MSNDSQLHFVKTTQKKKFKLEIESGNPLFNELVLRELLGYLTAPGKESHQTLKNARLVCHKWHLMVSPTFQFRSILSSSSSTNDLSHLIETLPPTLLNLERILATSLQISNSDWFKDNQFHHWINSYKSKLIGLKLKSLVLSNLTELLVLLEKCTNLKEVTLDHVSLAYSYSQSSQFFESQHQRYQFNFKYFTAIHNGWLHCSGQYEASILAKCILLGNPPLDSINLQFQKESCNIIDFISSNKVNILNNLRKLELKGIWDPINHYQLLSNNIAFELKMLKELLIEVEDLNGLLPFLESLRDKLEKVTFILDTIPEGRLNNAIVLPLMPKLRDFALFFKSDLDSRNRFISNLPTAYFTRVYTTLKSFTAGEFSWIGSETEVKIPEECAYASCLHVQQLLGTIRSKDIVPSLERLELSCAFTSTWLLSHVTCIFPNLKVFSLWIDSPTLNEYFVLLKNLRKLEFLTIKLSRSILDLPLSLNYNLPSLVNLKEFKLEKVDRIWKSRWDKRLVEISNLDEIDGIMKCKSLKIVSIQSIKIDSKELENLRLKILEKKPKLVLNATDYKLKDQMI